jgi:hypothetical protein
MLALSLCYRAALALGALSTPTWAGQLADSKPTVRWSATSWATMNRTALSARPQGIHKDEPALKTWPTTRCGHGCRQCRDQAVQLMAWPGTRRACRLDKLSTTYSNRQTTHPLHSDFTAIRNRERVFR